MFSFAMVLAPFDRGLSGQEKTTLVHGKTNTELILGTKAGKTSAVPPKLAQVRPLGDVPSHVFPW
jgi:hypothetical protein